MIATQNPIEYVGTYPLPEAQLDRFMMKLSIGYPAEEEELRMAQRFLSGEAAKKVEAVLEPEDILEMLQFAPPKEAPAILPYLAFQPVIGISVVEEFEILVGSSAETVFESDIGKERLVGRLSVGTSRHFSTEDDAQAVVPEAFGELERVVGVHGTRCVSSIVDAHGEVERAQRIACDVVDLTLQE